jgi:hypothetical protein
VNWAEGPHAGTFVVSEDGENNSCARCHAPVVWIPSMDDMPESCLTCKFEIDPPPKFIPETDWTNVECKVCHKVKKDEVQPDFAWLEIAPIEEYAEVATTTELCEKCHLAGELEAHTSIVVEGDHPGYVCTDCHDPHGLKASCSDDGCHAGVGEAVEIPGHDEDHAMVSCVACHDGGELAVQLDDETGLWTTYIPTGNGGSQELMPFTSHDIVLQAPCERCHYAGNPWGLGDEVQTP